MHAIMKISMRRKMTFMFKPHTLSVCGDLMNLLKTILNMNPGASGNHGLLISITYVFVLTFFPLLSYLNNATVEF